MDLEVVYKADEETYVKLMQLLREEGFRPVALENPNSDALYIAGSGGCVHIAVPREEKAGAEAVLREWDEKRAESVKNITEKLTGQFLFSIFVAVVIGLIFFVFGILRELFVFLIFIWLGLFVLFANTKKPGRGEDLAGNSAEDILRPK